VTDADDLMIINRSGLTIRLSMSELRTIGRATQGVRLFKVAANDEISSVAKVAAVVEQELEALAEEAVNADLPLGDTSDVVAADSSAAPEAEEQA
jgi:DNA gyrase subunit A